MTGKRPRIPTGAERELWRTVVRDAVPIRRRSRSAPKDGTALTQAVPPPPEAPPPAPDPKPPAARPAAAPPAMPAPPDLPVRARSAVKVHLAPNLLGAKAGLDKRTDEKVRRGRLPIDARIDLHGLTQDEAHAALAGFIRRCHGNGHRLVLVITGKGGAWKGDGPRGDGVLKSTVPRWLNEAALRPLILAVHPAQPQHGGGGALYVFLKRVRDG